MLHPWYVSGITSNLFVIALVCMISWYQLIHSEDYKLYVKNIEKLKDFESSFDYDDEDDGNLYIGFSWNLTFRL